MDERWNSWLRHLLVAKLEPEPRPLPAGSLNLTSLSDSHAPAQPAAAPGPDWPQMGKPWPSSSQGPIKGSAPPPHQGLSPSSGSAGKPAAQPGPEEWPPLQDSLQDAQDTGGLIGGQVSVGFQEREGLGGAVGRGATCCWSGCVCVCVGGSPGPTLGSARAFLVGGGLTCHKPPVLKDSKIGSISNPNSCRHLSGCPLCK